MIPFSLDQVEYFLLIFVRISTTIALLPIFGSQAVPVQLKVALSLILALILFNSVMSIGPVTSQPLSTGTFIMLIVKEAAVGLGIGFVSSLLFTAVQFAGRLIDTEIGFGFVELMDPFTDEPVTVLGQLQVIIFTILFLLFNGHYFLILAIQKSFELVPLMNVHFPSGQLAFHVTALVGNVFVLAIKFSAPIYVTLVLTELSLGVVARTVPQINIFFVGLPLKIAVGLGSAIIVLPLLASFFQRMVEALIQDIWKLLYLMS
ncbi:MAG: flagellar type III secretion system protein FliR [Fibrobacter sp.]|nr:flagellar type III secretion system protein FliR [Fibrobacter sp.]